MNPEHHGTLVRITQRRAPDVEDEAILARRHRIHPRREVGIRLYTRRPIGERILDARPGRRWLRRQETIGSGGRSSVMHALEDVDSVVHCTTDLARSCLNDLAVALRTPGLRHP